MGTIKLIFSILFDFVRLPFVLVTGAICGVEYTYSQWLDDLYKKTVERN